MSVLDIYIQAGVIALFDIGKVGVATFGKFSLKSKLLSFISHFQ